MIDTFDGQERLTLRDERGFQDEVAIGPDTRIVPRGTRLVPGMRIAITGYNGGNWFDAISIQVLQSSRSSGLPSYAGRAAAEAAPPPADPAVPTYADPEAAQSDLTQRGEPIILRATWAPYPVAIDDPSSAYLPAGANSLPFSGAQPKRTRRAHRVASPSEH
jgi:hypothetical protein